MQNTIFYKKTLTAFILYGIFLPFCAFYLSNCSSVGDAFDFGDDEPARLEGERISVLELQKSLEAEAPQDKQQELSLPKSWKNEFWPQQGGYPNHSMQHLELADNLSLFWEQDIGQGSKKDLPLITQPLVVNDKVFTLDTKSNLKAFDINSTQEIWSTAIAHPEEEDLVIGGGIAFSAGALYATNGFNELLALNPNNGQVIWRKTLPAAARAAPSVMDGRVYVAMMDNRLLALNSEDGSLFWEYTGLGETAGLLGAASPAVNRDIVVPVFSSGEITALRVENGSVAWSDNLSSLQRFGGLASLSDIKGLPVLDQGLVIAVSFGGRMVAIDERSGARIWQREIGSSQTPWVSGKVVFVLTTDNQLVALNREDGLIHWVLNLPKNVDNDTDKDYIHWSGPVLASNRLILVNSEGYVAEIDALGGELIKSWKAHKKGLSLPPIVAGGVLYLLAEDGTLQAYR